MDERARATCSMTASLRAAAGCNQFPPQMVATGVISDEAVRSEGDSIPLRYGLLRDGERQDPFTLAARSYL